MKELIGKTIKSIVVEDDGSKIGFLTKYSNEIFLYEVDAECCAQSYVYEILGIDSLKKDGMVTKVEEKEHQEIDEDAERHDEVIETYGYTIHTMGGHIDIIFRVEHNGYYGGHCTYMNPNNIYHIPIYQQFISDIESKKNMIDITTDDWMIDRK